MTMERKRYRFGSFSWFLVIIILIGVYFIFYDNQTVFFITAGIAIFLGAMLWFLARRGVVSRTKALYGKLDNYHSNIQDRYKSDQRIISLKDKNNTSIFCEHCGHKIDDDSSFCSNCGQEI